jgi:hypothetical protein
VLDQCNPGYSNCDGSDANGCEVNTNADPKNCGGCGTVCPPNTPACASGKCSNIDLSGIYNQFQSSGRNVYIWKTPGMCVTLAQYKDFCPSRGLSWWSPKSAQDAQMLITTAFNYDGTHTWIQVYGLITTLGTVGGYNVTVDSPNCVEGNNDPNAFGAFRKWGCSFCNPQSNAMQQDNGQSCCWDKGHAYDWFVCQDG